MRDPNNPIATFVRSLMADKGWTQERLADAIGGIERSAISQWATGRTMPDDDKLKRLATLANVDEEYLIRLKQEVELSKRGIEIQFKRGDILNEEEKAVLAMMRTGDYGSAITLLCSRMKRSAA